MAYSIEYLPHIFFGDKAVHFLLKPNGYLTCMIVNFVNY